MSGGASCPPEDIALRAAESIAVFQARLQHTSAILGPWDVLSVGEHWKVISDSLESFDPCWPCTWLFECDRVPDMPPADVQREQLSVAFVEDALAALVAALTSLKEELAARVHKALGADTRQGKEYRSSHKSYQEDQQP